MRHCNTSAALVKSWGVFVTGPSEDSGTSSEGGSHKKQAVFVTDRRFADGRLDTLGLCSVQTACIGHDLDFFIHGQHH